LTGRPVFSLAIRTISSEPSIASTKYPLERKYLLSLPEDDTVLHLDFHTGNVLVDPDGNCTVIDWMTAARGNRAVEEAMMEFLFSEAELFPEAGKLQKAFFAAVRGYIGKQFFKEYQKLTPLSAEEIDRYRLPALIIRRSWNIDFEKPYLTKTIRELIRKYGIS
jgi:aminoglycoside phosphotransferase (APT) family kinase protein